MLTLGQQGLLLLVLALLYAGGISALAISEAYASPSTPSSQP